MSRKICRSFWLCTLLHLSLLPFTYAATVVKWDALKNLDDLAERCATLSEAKDLAALRPLMQPIKTAMVIVAAEPVPAGAKAPDQVKILQTDLNNLAEALSDPDIQAHAGLIAIFAGIHPVVEKLMETAGMPHVHEDDEHAGKQPEENRP